jgi:alpha,alpha-trehalose-phosphate synthase [UDP-forming]
MWTKEDLQQLVRREIGDYRLIVVSNRQPYIHKLVDGKVKYVVPAGGLINAIDPLMQACGGTWVAHGGGTGDRLVVEAGNKVMVPPDDPSYTLRLVWLTEEEEQGYYYGFSNGALWPLCHNAYTEPVFNYQDWETYKAVNRLFADHVLNEIAGKPAVVFTQDYHLALLPRFIRAADPDVITGQFWHIPWPNPDIFRICPWQDEILDGLLGNDLLGFHIGEHSNNFMSTVAQALDARVDSEYNLIHYSGETTLVRPFPISVDFEEICQEAQSDEVSREVERLIDELDLGDKVVGLGIDRIDYTKGIPHRLKAFGRFLEKYPEYRGRAVFVQAGVISRFDIDAYRRLSEEIEELVDQINGQFSKGGWQPIIYLPTDLPSVTLLALRRLARFCVVSSLHDGMNLVAKEYVASRFDEDGVLILSPFTGAVHELTQALIANPYGTEDFADAILRAVTMPRQERRFRMAQMRYTVRENNIYKWAAQLLVQLLQGIRPSRATYREAYLPSPAH